MCTCVCTLEPHATAKDMVTAGCFSTSGYLNSRSDVLGSSFSPPFFFGCVDGKVYYADDLGHSTEVRVVVKVWCVCEP